METESTETEQVSSTESKPNWRRELEAKAKRADELESQLVEAKMKWANLDMENDELCMKIQHKNEQLKKIST